MVGWRPAARQQGQVAMTNGTRIDLDALCGAQTLLQGKNTELLVSVDALLSGRHTELKHYLDKWMAQEKAAVCFLLEQHWGWRSSPLTVNGPASKAPGEREVMNSGIGTHLVTLELAHAEKLGAFRNSTLVEAQSSSQLPIKNTATAEDDIPAEAAGMPIQAPRASASKASAFTSGQICGDASKEDCPGEVSTTKKDLKKSGSVSFRVAESIVPDDDSDEEWYESQASKSRGVDRRGSDRKRTSMNYQPAVTSMMTTFTDADRNRMTMAKDAAERGLTFEETLTTSTHIARSIRVKARLWVDSKYFEPFFAVIIIVNSLLLGIQLEYMSHERENLTSEPLPFFAVQNIFACLFLAEVVIRLVADGYQFFCSLWNYLDLFVVISSIIELFLDIVTMSTMKEQNEGFESVGNIRIMRMLRITRLARVIRVIKIVRFVYSLRTLITSIVCTLRSLFWAMCLLTMIIYLWAMVLAQFANESLKKGNGSVLLDFYWGSLTRSMFTLFKSVSGGVSWEEASTALDEVHTFCVMLFTIYIIFTYFAVLNVVTGVFCQSAIESAERDYDLVVQSNLADKEHYTKKLRQLFDDIDDDQNQQIDIREFEQHLGDEKVQAYLTSLELNSSDIWRLFKLLDVNESQVIDVEEFLAGCFRLRGPAKAIEMAEVMYEMRHTRKKLFSFMNTVDKALHAIIGSMGIVEDDEDARRMVSAWSHDSLEQSDSEHVKRRSRLAASSSASRQRSRSLFSEMQQEAKRSIENRSEHSYELTTRSNRPSQDSACTAFSLLSEQSKQSKPHEMLPTQTSGTEMSYAQVMTWEQTNEPVMTEHL